MLTVVLLASLFCTLCLARYRTLPPGTGLGGTITATDAVKRSSTLAQPYRTAGNTNHTTKRLFSSYNYMADPLSLSTVTPSYSHVNPFSVTTLPLPAALTSSSSAPAFNGASTRTSSSQPLYFAPLTLQSAASLQPRQQTAPVSGVAKRAGRCLSPSNYELERSWLSEPYIEQTYSSLYRAVRADRSSTEWRATNATGGEFDKRTHSYTQPATATPTKSKQGTSRHTQRVQHVDAWNVADGQGTSCVGGRQSSDIERMTGGVDKHVSSPFEPSERVMSGMQASGMRGGHRSGICVDGGHSHANVKVSGGGLRNEKHFHSRRSADGQCYHHCTGREMSTGDM